MSMHRPTQIAYASLYAGKFTLWGVALPFLSGWLALKGFTAAEIGLVTGAALVGRLVAGPAVAVFADGAADTRTPLRLVAFVFALSAAGLALSPSKPAIAFCAFCLLWTFGLLIPLTDAAVLRADRARLVNFGQTRALGSAAFLATTIIGGELLTRLGIGAAAPIMAAAGAATFAAALMAPNARPAPAPASSRWKDALRLLGEPRFLAVLAAAGLVQGAHAVYYSYSILHWSDLGYSPRIVGLLWATGVIAEIVLLTRARSLALKLRPDYLIALGAAGAALRWAITASEPPLGALFVVQLLHALTFGATYIGAIEFFDRAAPARLVNTAMTLNSTTGVGAITGVATVAAGFLMQNAGAPAAYALMAGMSVAALLIALAVGSNWKGERLFE